MRLDEVIDRDVVGKIAPAVLTKARDQLGEEDVEAVARSSDGKTLGAVTPHRIVTVHAKGDGMECPLSSLHSISILPSDNNSVLLAPLTIGQPFDAVRLEPAGADRLAEAVRARIAGNVSGDAWWDRPDADVGVILWPAGLLVKPATSILREKNWYTVSFVNTGVQIRAAKLPADERYPGDLREFVPWTSVQGVAVEGTNDIERRPSVGAVLAFGVLGLGASREIRRSYLVLGSQTGDYVFERQGMLPAELAAFLSPVLRNYSSTTQSTRETDPIDKLRRLAELRDDGVITPEEFDTKKAELLEEI